MFYDEENIPGNGTGNYSIVRTFTASDDAGNTSISSQTIDVSEFATGMYSLELSTDVQVLRSQVIVD